MEINGLQNGLNQAVEDIQKYVDALNLDNSLCAFRQRKQAYDEDLFVVNLAPGIETDNDGKSSV